VVAASPVLVLLHRARRDLRRAMRALDRDDLTGLASRRAFLTYLDAVRRTGRAAAVVLVDLDRFKAVNDRYGHHAGDDVLRQVAERLRGLGREVWLAARLAGDEFVLVVDAVHAVRVAGRIRQAIGGTPFVVGDHRFSVTASVGFAMALASSDHEVLRNADLSMYQDKAAGAARRPTVTLRRPRTVRSCRTGGSGSGGPLPARSLGRFPRMRSTAPPSQATRFRDPPGRGFRAGQDDQRLSTPAG
jgi:diguanylate cyclase (GGDEF)-like protein